MYPLVSASRTLLRTCIRLHVSGVNTALYVRQMNRVKVISHIDISTKNIILSIIINIIIITGFSPCLL